MRHKISTFRVDNELFGVDAMLVQEVSRHHSSPPCRWRRRSSPA